MTARAFARGHSIHFNGCWIYEDGVSITEERPCVRCNQMPVEGMDACLGKLGGVKSACCGHGVEEPYVIKQNGK